MLTHSKLQEVIHYDPTSGRITWLVDRGRMAKAGSAAGYPHKDGYVEVGLLGKTFLAHRLIWFWMLGRWPDVCIDHINGIRNDNRWVNLREATLSENNFNSKTRKDNTSGYKGVSWDAKSGAWRAVLFTKGKQVHIGQFKELEKAVAASRIAREKLHGDFANHG